MFARLVYASIQAPRFEVDDTRWIKLSDALDAQLKLLIQQEKSISHDTWSIIIMHAKTHIDSRVRACMINCFRSYFKYTSNVVIEDCSDILHCLLSNITNDNNDSNEIEERVITATWHCLASLVTNSAAGLQWVLQQKCLALEKHKQNLLSCNIYIVKSFSSYLMNCILASIYFSIEYTLLNSSELPYILARNHFILDSIDACIINKGVKEQFMNYISTDLVSLLISNDIDDVDSYAETLEIAFSRYLTCSNAEIERKLVNYIKMNDFSLSVQRLYGCLPRCDRELEKEICLFLLSRLNDESDDDVEILIMLCNNQNNNQNIRTRQEEECIKLVCGNLNIMNLKYTRNIMKLISIIYQYLSNIKQLSLSNLFISEYNNNIYILSFICSNIFIKFNYNLFMYEMKKKNKNMHTLTYITDANILSHILLSGEYINCIIHCLKEKKSIEDLTYCLHLTSKDENKDDNRYIYDNNNDDNKSKLWLKLYNNNNSILLLLLSINIIKYLQIIYNIIPLFFAHNLSASIIELLPELKHRVTNSEDYEEIGEIILILGRILYVCYKVEKIDEYKICMNIIKNNENHSSRLVRLNVAKAELEIYNHDHQNHSFMKYLSSFDLHSRVFDNEAIYDATEEALSMIETHRIEATFDCY